MGTKTEWNVVILCFENIYHRVATSNVPLGFDYISHIIFGHLCFMLHLKPYSHLNCLKTFNRGIFIFKHHLVSTRYDFEPCAFVLEVKIVMIKIVAEAKKASMKKEGWITLKSLMSKVKEWIPLKVVGGCSKIKEIQNLVMVFKLL